MYALYSTLAVNSNLLLKELYAHIKEGNIIEIYKLYKMYKIKCDIHICYEIVEFCCCGSATDKL